MMRELSTDRPDQTESPYTVDAGHFQIEMDVANGTIDRDQSNSGDVRSQVWNFGGLNLKAGLFNNVDLQFVLGLSLYLRLSPITRAAFADLAAAMRLSVLRFFLVEHGTGMLLGIGVLHMLRSRARRRQGPARHALTAVAALGALLCIAVSVPWPGLPYGRPLWRLPP